MRDKQKMRKPVARDMASADTPEEGVPKKGSRRHQKQSLTGMVVAVIVGIALFGVLMVAVTKKEKKPRTKVRADISSRASEKQKGETDISSKTPEKQEGETGPVANPKPVEKPVNPPKPDDDEKVPDQSDPVVDRKDEGKVEVEQPVEDPNDESPTLEQIFAEKLQKARDSEGIAAYLQLVGWCNENGMAAEVEEIYRQVLQTAPDNAEARTALGYVRIGSEWVKEDDAADQGFYKYKGKWYAGDELEKKGLILYEGEWLTEAEAKAKGLVKQEGKWVAKDDQYDDFKTDNKSGDTEKKAGGKLCSMQLTYQFVTVTMPKSYWQRGGTPLLNFTTS